MAKKLLEIETKLIDDIQLYANMAFDGNFTKASNELLRAGVEKKMDHINKVKRLRNRNKK